jgi:hypothetical protein
MCETPSGDFVQVSFTNLTDAERATYEDYRIPTPPLLPHRDLPALEGDFDAGILAQEACEGHLPALHDASGPVYIHPKVVGYVDAKEKKRYVNPEYDGPTWDTFSTFLHAAKQGRKAWLAAFITPVDYTPGGVNIRNTITHSWAVGIKARPEGGKAIIFFTLAPKTGNLTADTRIPTVLSSGQKRFFQAFRQLVNENFEFWYSTQQLSPGKEPLYGVI